jgi:hypothetical protein
VKICIATAAVALVLAIGNLTPASARPPTVMNSPGYELRLAESRKAWAAWQAQQDAAAAKQLRAPRSRHKPATASAPPPR